MNDKGEDTTSTTRAWAAALLIRIASGDPDAVQELADLAVEKPVAVWALQVAIELRVEAAQRAGGLPPLTAAFEERLDRAVRGAVEEQA